MIELVLGNHVNDFSAKELRRDAIEILLSIICLPLRYPTITLEDLEGFWIGNFYQLIDVRIGGEES